MSVAAFPPPTRAQPMSYRDFDLKTVVRTFGLSESRAADLFASVAAVAPGERLIWWLDRFAAVAVGVNTEMARSTFIVAPILAEAQVQSGVDMTIHTGVTLDVDRTQGLTGVCDYILARSAEFYYLQAPLVAVVEAKRDNVIDGLGQCAAEMVAIREFNKNDGAGIPAVYGVVTGGDVWKFLKLEAGVLSIDNAAYYLHDLPKILGILIHVARGS